MNKERRKSENTALRELIDALKKVINARDALWSLGFFDRLLRFDKCRSVFNEYDDAMLAVRNAVSGVMEASVQPEDLPAPPPNPGRGRATTITMEEFEVLLGKPRSLRKT